jgi:hypothetical protein
MDSTPVAPSGSGAMGRDACPDWHRQRNMHAANAARSQAVGEHRPAGASGSTRTRRAAGLVAMTGNFDHHHSSDET